VEATAGAVALRDPETRKLSLYLLRRPNGTLRRYPLLEAQGLVGHALHAGDVLVVDDAAQDPRADRELDHLVGFECRNALIVPLRGEGKEALGALALYNKEDGRSFHDADREVIELVAANVTTAVLLQLSREAREREERLTTIGRLLSSVIHDLKTPLTVISGYVQMMATADDPSQRARYAEQVLKQFDHIAAMQREVLEFARGEKSVLIRKVYLKKFFDEVREQLGPELAKRNVELVIDLMDKSTARFDEGKIVRVIHNLARNAAEAMGERGGRFSIRVARDVEGQELILTFADTGPGLPPEIEHRLFESFVTTGKKGGTGLGLAIVKKIAEEHGGSISAQSSPRGATFKLRIPQHAASLSA
jgi:signal transduction histidine kinase